MIVQSDSATPTNESTINANNSDDFSSKKTKEGIQKSASVGHQDNISNKENPIAMNLYNLANQILTLPYLESPDLFICHKILQLLDPRMVVENHAVLTH